MKLFFNNTISLFLFPAFVCRRLMHTAGRGIFLLFGLVIFFNFSFAQKVGVVLSGGGAAAMAHVGFLKVLEENGIPIDYIVGNSMGALVGGLYAAGYSPEEMEMHFTSEEFYKMTQGKIDDKFLFYFKEKEVDASWINVHLAPDKPIGTAIPTNIISPIAMDFGMMEGLAGAAAAADYNFDKLFVPYRCVAADIDAKIAVPFSKGNLSKAIRASMSFPFYLKPVTIDGKLYFDGGLYNNFPSDIMYQDFMPDFILGSNVAANPPPPDEDNILSQIKTMLMAKTNFSPVCENGIIIEHPVDDISTFDFLRNKDAIIAGDSATQKRIEEIKAQVTRRVDKETVMQRRKEFREKQPALKIDNIYIEGLKRNQAVYVKKSLRRKNNEVAINEIKPAYFRLFSDDKISHIFPTAKYNKESGYYDLYLDVKKEKDLFLDFGGNFASRPINTAFIGAQYNYLGSVAASIMANAYFGKLYGSVQLKARIDFPIVLPFYLEPEFTMNRWDYFKSKATFFEDVKPSYLVQNERFGGVTSGFPSGSNGRIIAGCNFGLQNDEYYQTKTFTSLDTVDHTEFGFFSPSLMYERSSLNKKLYPNQGSYFAIKTRYVNGEEFYIPGSTSNTDRNFSRFREWYQVKMVYDNYYKRKGHLRLGIYAEGVYSSQELFKNYTASILKAPAFQPTPESKTLFLESFRSYQYGAVGHKIIISFMESFDLRLEGYIFQPFRTIIKQENKTASFGRDFDKRYIIGTSALVFHSPLGPVSMSLNYYHNVPEVAQVDKTPVTVLFHFGYILFNKSALD